MSKSEPELSAGARHQRLETAWLSASSDLKRYLAFRLGNEAEAQDLAQEAYLRLMRIRKPELVRKPHAYLFRIAANLANEYHLKAARNLESADIDEVCAAGNDSDESSFETRLELREQVARLDEIIADLPELYRAILIMRKRDGYSHQEIADKLEISPHTVHTYLKRALVRCRADWTE